MPVTSVTHARQQRDVYVRRATRPHPREGWAESMKALAASEARSVWPDDMGDEVELPAW